MRPVLSPAARRLWRDPQTLQLGRTSGRAVVLAGLEPADRRVLALLDGTREVGDVLDAATAAGCPPGRAEALLDLLGEAGLVLDAAGRWPPHLSVHERDRLVADVASLGLLRGGDGLPSLARRARSRVVVIGAGRVGAPLAALLASGGVGTVDVTDEGSTTPGDLAAGGLATEDLGARRGPATRARLSRAWPGTRGGPVADPDLVVLAPTTAVDDVDVLALSRAGRPHLLAEVRETVGVVGPLVVPGHSACLRCLDLERSDRDPGWPALVAQLSGPGRQPPVGDAALAAAVAAQAALQALALLDGDTPASLGGSLELALPDWRWRRRTWQVHPACACRWQQAC